MTDNLWRKLEEQRIRRRNTVDLLTRLEELCGDDGDLSLRDLYDDDVVDAIARIKDLEAALSHYACGCKKDYCTPEKSRYRDLKCGWPATQALEGRND
jgi:hypothetical protein